MSEEEQPELLDAASYTRHGVMQVLVGALLFPVGTLDERSVIELVQLSLKTYAWAVREEMVLRMRANLAKGKGPIDDNTLASLLAVAMEERIEKTIKLGEVAAFVANVSVLTNPSRCIH